MSFKKAPADAALLKQGLAVTEGFAAWSPWTMDRLLSSARLQRYQRGNLVHSEGIGDPEILVVVSGYLMACRTDLPGSQAYIGIVGPGLVVGVPRGLSPDDEARYDYRAHSSAVVVHLSTRAVFDILDSEPLLWRSMARMLLRQQRQALVTLLNHLTGSLRQRLAATLERFAQIYGVDDSIRKLRLRLSQEDLAAMLQVSRQSINREMNAFEKLGLISVEYGAVILYDLPALRQLGAGVRKTPVPPSGVVSGLGAELG